MCQWWIWKCNPRIETLTRHVPLRLDFSSRCQHLFSSRRQLLTLNLQGLKIKPFCTFSKAVSMGAQYTSDRFKKSLEIVHEVVRSFSSQIVHGPLSPNHEIIEVKSLSVNFQCITSCCDHSRCSRNPWLWKEWTEESCPIYSENHIVISTYSSVLSLAIVFLWFTLLWLIPFIF